MRSTHRHALGVLALSVLLTAVGTASCVAEPRVPADDGEVLERLPVSLLDPRMRQLAAMRAALLQRPDDVALATRLASLYVEAGRRGSDPRFYGYAQGALAPWWQAVDAPLPVLVLRATIRQHDHDFPGALADLAAALRADPANAQAWLTQAIVQQVRGDYAAARESCLAVLQLANPLVAVTCLSSVDSLHGAAAKSYDILYRALEQHPANNESERRWALTTLAEIAARRGDPERADAHYRAALSLEGRDDYLLGSYADFLLDQGRAGAVRELLAGATRADALLLRLALAESVLRAPEVAADVQALRDRFAAARLRGDAVHRREEARFALDVLGDPHSALQLARDNWQVQREPWDARILLESALASGDAAAAQPAVEFVSGAGLEDVTLTGLTKRVQDATR